MNRSKISRRTHDLTECTVGDSEYRNVLNRRAVQTLYFNKKTHLFSGRVLLLTSLMVLVLMLRSLQTQLRNWGLSAILPLDHHVYLHKITGVAIFGLAWLHAIMHLINFGKPCVKLSRE